MNVEIKLLRKGVELPRQGTPMSAGRDLQAMIDAPLILAPNQRELVPSGIAIFLNTPDLAAVILPRSGLGHKKGLVIGNLVGVIDGDYQGEIMISAWNRSNEPIRITPGEHIAQLLVVPVLQVGFNVVEEFSATTSRGEGGFGSTTKG